jgi:hypothetical protein
MIRPMKEVVQDAPTRAALVNDTATLIDDEVSRKGGLSGVALKGGYAVVKRLKSGRMIHNLVSGMLDDFINVLEPIHAEYRDATGPAQGFDGFLIARDAQAADTLLHVTDKRAERHEDGILKSTYYKLRPKGVEHVRQALPALGKLVDRYCGGHVKA